MISNGYINPAPLADLTPYLDAANIDLKSMDDATCRTLTGGRLQPGSNQTPPLHIAATLREYDKFKL